MKSTFRRKLERRQSHLEQEMKFKLVVLGMSGGGKTALTLRHVNNTFNARMSGTLGVSFLRHTLSIGEKTAITEIWDTAGQERFRSLVPMYYRGAHAAIIVYDIQSRESFHSAKYWVETLRQEGPLNIVIGLAGNKADLAHKRKVSFNEGKRYAEENGLTFMETSAKTAMNVDDIFVAIVTKLVDKWSKNEPDKIEAMQLSENKHHYCWNCSK